MDKATQTTGSIGRLENTERIDAIDCQSSTSSQSTPPSTNMGYNDDTERIWCSCGFSVTLKQKQKRKVRFQKKWWQWW